ncbi:hypothetical protein AKO1_004331 [Acrasis kona]|uniref:Guanylate cyclase domain-containing protein n=1 Tax=Acrasis kona TaxID=1008807 RepID=A0AAW2Z5R7_9EUKA
MLNLSVLLLAISISFSIYIYYECIRSAVYRINREYQVAVRMATSLPEPILQSTKVQHFVDDRLLDELVELGPSVIGNKDNWLAQEAIDLLSLDPTIVFERRGGQFVVVLANRLATSKCSHGGTLVDFKLHDILPEIHSIEIAIDKNDSSYWFTTSLICLHSEVIVNACVKMIGENRFVIYARQINKNDEQLADDLAKQIDVHQLATVVVIRLLDFDSNIKYSQQTTDTDSMIKSLDFLWLSLGQLCSQYRLQKLFTKSFDFCCFTDDLVPHRALEFAVTARQHLYQIARTLGRRKIDCRVGIHSAGLAKRSDGAVWGDAVSGAELLADKCEVEGGIHVSMSVYYKVYKNFLMEHATQKMNVINKDGKIKWSQDGTDGMVEYSYLLSDETTNVVSDVDYFKRQGTSTDSDSGDAESDVEESQTVRTKSL